MTSFSVNGVETVSILPIIAGRKLVCGSQCVKQYLSKWFYLKITTLRKNQVPLRSRQDSGHDLVNFGRVLVDENRAGAEDQPIQTADEKGELSIDRHSSDEMPHASFSSIERSTIRGG